MATTVSHFIETLPEVRQIARVLNFDATLAPYIEWDAVARTARELGAHFEARGAQDGAIQIVMFWAYADDEAQASGAQASGADGERRTDGAGSTVLVDDAARQADDLLTVGEYYDRQTLRLLGWKAPNGVDVTGYSLDAYFEADGGYLGPDRFGVEPRVAKDDDRCDEIERSTSERRPVDRRCTKPAGHVGGHAMSPWVLS